MRAVIQCRLNGVRQAPAEEKPVPEVINGILEECNWKPLLEDSQGDAERKKRRDKIIEILSERDQEVVKNTLLGDVYEPRTKTWGIYNRPTRDTIEFRLQNSNCELLKDACSNLVTDLRKYERTQNGKSRINFEINKTVLVLQPGTAEPAFSGQLIEDRDFRFSILSRKSQFWTGALAMVFAVIVTYVTCPWGPLGHEATSASPWRVWSSTALAHAIPAALVTTAVSWLEVFFFWRKVRREVPIMWSTHQASLDGDF